MLKTWDHKLCSHLFLSCQISNEHRGSICNALVIYGKNPKYRLYNWQSGRPKAITLTARANDVNWLCLHPVSLHPHIIHKLCFPYTLTVCADTAVILGILYMCIERGAACTSRKLMYLLADLHLSVLQGSRMWWSWAGRPGFPSQRRTDLWITGSTSSSAGHASTSHIQLKILSHSGALAVLKWTV